MMCKHMIYIYIYIYMMNMWYHDWPYLSSTVWKLELPFASMVNLVNNFRMNFFFSFSVQHKSMDPNLIVEPNSRSEVQFPTWITPCSLHVLIVRGRASMQIEILEPGSHAYKWDNWPLSNYLTTKLVSIFALVTTILVPGLLVRSRAKRRLNTSLMVAST